MSTEQEFHKRRILFVVKDGKVFINKYTKKSHEEWFRQMGWNVSQIMNNSIRGYYDGTAIYCYCGYNFREPDSSLIIDNLKNIVKKLEISNLETKVHSGVVVGKIGDKWKPQKTLGNVGQLVPELRISPKTFGF